MIECDDVSRPMCDRRTADDGRPWGSGVAGHELVRHVLCSAADYVSVF
jgi:hypothetical protein